MGYALSAGDTCHFMCFLGFFEKPPGGEALYHQATQACELSFWVFNEFPGSDEQPPGGANQFGLILAFSGF